MPDGTLERGRPETYVATAAPKYCFAVRTDVATKDPSRFALGASTGPVIFSNARSAASFGTRNASVFVPR